MVPLGDVGQVESRFGTFGDSDCVGARLVHGLCQTYHWSRNHFARPQWYSLVTRLKWQFNSVRLEIVAIFTQDRCIVCTKHTIGSEIIFDAPGGTPR
jgi:hypothetical protein